MMQYNIIGAGKLGLAIAYCLEKNHKAKLLAVCNQSLDAAQRSCALLGFGQAVAHIKDLPAADITFITCPDDHIAAVVAQLQQHNKIDKASLVIHCSGVLDSSVLLPLGGTVASFHPLKAFRAGHLAADLFKNTYCTLEGDKAACDWLQKVFGEMQAHISPITAKQKPAYHAAACMGMNYLVTLASHCETLFLQAGLPKDLIKDIICNQMQGALDNVQQAENIQQALTGPLLRGDSKTIALHVQAIQDPLIKAFYQAAAWSTLPLTGLNEEKKQAVGWALAQQKTVYS